MCRGLRCEFNARGLLYTSIHLPKGACNSLLYNRNYELVSRECAPEL